MVSGMSVWAEIIAETLDNTLALPIETVFNVDGKPTCYVRKGGDYENRPVKIGKSNDNMVQIVEGLSEGEEVYLHPPQAAGQK